MADQRERSAPPAPPPRTPAAAAAIGAAGSPLSPARPRQAAAYQFFPANASTSSAPKESAPSIRKYFKFFPYLHDDLKLCVLSYVADAPFETLPRNYPQSFLTHELPIVSRRFRSICDSDVLWKDAVVRVTKQEPGGMWTEALQSMCRSERGDKITSGVAPPTPPEDESILALVERTRRTLSIQRPLDCSYKSIYKTVVNQHLRFKGPVFLMQGQVALGQTYALHFFEYRYRLLIAAVMRDQPHEARHGGPLAADLPPACFIHANRSSPLEPAEPAVLVRVVQCQIYPDGRADVLLLPVRYCWMERSWVPPDTGNLHYAQCLKMGRDVTSQMNHLQRQEALAHVMDRLAGQLVEGDDDDEDESPANHTTTTTDADGDDDDDDEDDNDSHGSYDDVNDVGIGREASDDDDDDDDFDGDDLDVSSEEEEEDA